MQEDFENCVNMDVIEKPNEWTTNFVTHSPVFRVWDQTSQLQVAAQTAQAIIATCSS
jgi:hypothetical protein